MVRALMIVLAVLFTTPSEAGPNISYQTEGEYIPRPDIAAEMLIYFAGQMPFGLGYVASAMTDHATRNYGVGAPYREVPKPIMPGKVAHAE